jgi:squalene/oxidosqualene cyclase-like protein
MQTQAVAARPTDASLAITRALSNLEKRQDADGSWRGDYGGPMFLLPMFVALAYTSGRTIPEPRRSRIITYLYRVQRADGSIGLHAEASTGSMFTTSLVYVALRMLGEGRDDDGLARMRTWIARNGSPLGAASWGKFVLCTLGLYDWRGVHPTPPESWLLPYATPFHPGRLWCHCRQVYLPMAWLYGTRSTLREDDLVRQLRDELYSGQWHRIDWPREKDTVSAVDDYRPLTRSFKSLSHALSRYENRPIARLRRRALDECLEHIRYEDRVTNDIDIGPVNAVLNTVVHWFRGEEGKADFERGWQKLQDYLWDDERGATKMQGYNSSQLWDTAFAVQAILATQTRAHDRVLSRAYTYLRDNQILEDVPDAAAHYRHASKGGWPFSTRAHGWPITDCTAEGFKCAVALEGRFEPKIPVDLLRESVSLMLSWQNDDGGWATYERTRTGAWIEALNPSQVFGDIMIDYSHVECTSACVQALSRARHRFPDLEKTIDRAIDRGVAFLRNKQRADGSWEGAWAVCFTYGTWFAIHGLMAAGVSPRDPAIERGCQFLVEKQRADGSWSEHGDTCKRREWTDGERGHVVQTSWAMLALLRAEYKDGEILRRAAAFLVRRQEADGSWAREPLVGVFNRTCLIDYDNYRHIFPMWALAEWQKSAR